jgi:hypothetical protein
MAHFLDGMRRRLLPGICVTILCSIVAPTGGRAAAGGPQLSDSLYNAHHPRLLFTSQQLPGLYAAVRDGGDDGQAYADIRQAAEFVYPASTMEELLGDDYGLTSIPNLGLAGFLESPPDTAALALGRTLVVYLAENFDVDDDDFGSSLRLRALALGYDMFFGDGPEAERDLVRGEIASYLDEMMNSPIYAVWGFRPYLGNRSAMIAASVGLAAICLEGETDPSTVAGALDFADDMISEWLEHQVDAKGAYNEGVVYGGWSLRMLVYYFHARKSYDGFDYSDNARIRSMENWFAYELLPEGSGRTNNLNDCAYGDYILSRHHTYFDWAESEWNSGLSAWLWQHTAGDEGWDWELAADKAATALWNRSLPVEQPGDVLPQSMMWEHRGLYYFRTGWELGPSSNDLVFSFYSGTFQGAHAQEDQGQFTFYAYGAKFAIDHGPGPVARQTESHNLVLIDGRGQHNAGSSIGTDGVFQKYLLSDYADYVVGDLTEAYTTHSPWNDPDVPFPGTDWSWGYDGGNPVNRAVRKVVTVHDDYLPPYFVIVDDVDKDGLAHQYEWRMHTLAANAVDTSTDPIVVSNGQSRLDIHVIEPTFASLQKSVASYDNGNEEPDALVLSLAITGVDTRYVLLMYPTDGSVGEPSVSKDAYSWGHAVTLNWGLALQDVIVCNASGGTVATAGSASMETDATLAVVRTWYGSVLRYLLANATTFVHNDTEYVDVADGPLTCAMSQNVINIDRQGAAFRFYAPGIDEVYYREQRIEVISQDGYLTPDPLAGGFETPPSGPLLRARAYPNPFNPTTVVRVELEQRATVKAVIYNVEGMPVKTLWRGDLSRGSTALEWRGEDDAGNRVASGVYFLKIETGKHSKILKLVVIK